MMWTVAIERGFRLTNRMLSDLRASGYYDGKRASGAAPFGRKRDFYAEEVADIRNVVALHFRPLARQRSGGRVNVAIVVLGHPKHDPDAWYLAGKAIVDGMVEAKFLASDRREVGLVTGVVAAVGVVEVEALGVIPPCCRVPGWRGVVVHVAELGHA